ncbi:MAG: choice-of-anchor R domain-containing protein [Anaerolineaceae bacterium]
MFRVIIYSRDFQLISQPRFIFKPLACSWHAMGGPDRARIAVSGDPRALPSLSALHGMPITIHDPRGDPYWWGYLHGISIQDGLLAHSLNLDGIANRVAVLYTLPARPPAGGDGITSRMTPWAEDPASQSLYGIHEHILELGGVSESGALSVRNSELALNAYPRWSVRRSAAGSMPVMLECRGWIETLTWRYYSCDIGYIGNTHPASGVTSLGTWAIRKLAQSFTPSNSWPVESVGLRLRKVGSGHADQLKVEICADAGGQPGTALGMALVAPTGLPAGMEWVELTLDDPIVLSTGNPCWLVASRSGVPDDANHYIIDLDEELGFSGGCLKLWDGAVWHARSPDADLVFTLNGNAETTTQVVEIITNSGQFLAGTRIEIPSGVYTTPWREGRKSALDELEALMVLGDSEGRELLARVDANRVLVVERKTMPGEADWQVASDGRQVDQHGVRQPRWRVPVGRWVKGKGWQHAPSQSLGGYGGAGFVGEWEYRF